MYICYVKWIKIYKIIWNLIFFSYFNYILKYFMYFIILILYNLISIKVNWNLNEYLFLRIFPGHKTTRILILMSMSKYLTIDCLSIRMADSFIISSIITKEINFSSLWLFRRLKGIIEYWRISALTRWISVVRQIPARSWKSFLAVSSRRAWLKVECTKGGRSTQWKGSPIRWRKG